MAAVTPTLSSAVSLTDTAAVVSSASGIAAGMAARCDDETMKVAQNYVAGGTTVPLLRGQDGSRTAAHRSGANISFGLASDFGDPPPGAVVTSANAPIPPVYSYSASGVIASVPGVHILNGTSVLTMTIGSPTKVQDGALLVIVSNGKAAHTVTYTTTGFGGGGGASDAFTFLGTQQQAIMVVAANGVWVIIGTVGGAGTVAGTGLA